MIYQHLYNGKKIPCIHTGMNPRSFAQSTLTGLMHETGYRIGQDGRTVPFLLDNTLCITEHGCEWIVLPLPFYDGEPLMSTYDESSFVLPDSPLPITKNRAEKAQQMCRLFSKLITASEKKTISPAFLYAAAAAGDVCFLSGQNEDLIVLPPHLILSCRNAHTEHAVFYTAQVHPDGQNAEMKAVAFFLAALLYRCLSGYQPFFSTVTHKACRGKSKPLCSTEDMIQNIRTSSFIPFSFLCPNSTSALATAIDSGLSHHTIQDASEIVWQLCSFGTQNEPLITDTAVYPYNSVKIFIQKKQKKNTYKYFFKKHTGKLVGIAAGVAILCTLCTLLVLKWHMPPDTAGKSAEEIVHLFYHAINSLEHGQLGMYTRGAAGALYEKPLLNLFFASTMRETFERKKPYYTPQEFLALCKSIYTEIPESSGKTLLYHKGRAALKGGAVYGLSHLSITPIEETDETAYFDVSFYYWLPIFPAEAAEQLLNSTPEEAARYDVFPLQITFHQDTVQLSQINNVWYITNIRIEQRQLAETAVEHLFDYFIDTIDNKDIPLYLQDE